MNHNRPKNLNLFTIRFPLTAIASILHRISGFVLFLIIPLFLYGLSVSLESSDSFDALHFQLTTFFGKIFIWLILAPFLYHFAAGIKHLLLDLDIGVEAKSAKLGSKLLMAVFIFLMILAGIYLW